LAGFIGGWSIVQIMDIVTEEIYLRLWALSILFFK
jgi:hypothetical protein